MASKVIALPVVRVERNEGLKIVMDVWGGKSSQEHVARYIRTFDEVIDISRDELRRGLLVNLRTDAAWGDYEEFDKRKAKVQ